MWAAFIYLILFVYLSIYLFIYLFIYCNSRDPIDLLIVPYMVYSGGKKALIFFLVPTSSLFSCLLIVLLWTQILIVTACLHDKNTGPVVENLILADFSWLANLKWLSHNSFKKLSIFLFWWQLKL